MSGANDKLYEVGNHTPKEMGAGNAVSIGGPTSEDAF
jgi:hypothetical protein